MALFFRVPNYNRLLIVMLNLYKKHKDPIHIAILIILCIFVFSNILNSYFSQIDDLGPVVQSVQSLAGIFTSNTFGQHGWGNYRPIEVLSHTFDSYIYGPYHPFGSHLTNLVVHIFNGILVYILALRLSQKSEIALITGLLFITSPIHSQSLPPVAWVSGRTDLLVSCFYLLTVILFIQTIAARSYITYLVSFLTFILALISKEMAATLPAVVLLYILLFTSQETSNENRSLKPNRLVMMVSLSAGVLLIVLGITLNVNLIANNFAPDGILELNSIRKVRLLQLCLIASGSVIIFAPLVFRLWTNTAGIKILLSLPYFLILFFYLITRIIVLETLSGRFSFSSQSTAIPTVASPTFQVGIDTFMRDIFSLLGLVWPLGVDYHRYVWSLQIEHGRIFILISAIVSVGLALLLAKIVVSRSKAITFSYLWIFVTLAPVHNIIVSSWLYQSRYLYLPSVGFYIFVAILLYKLNKYVETLYRVPKIVGLTLILFIVSFNSVFLIRHNEHLAKNGDIIWQLVSDMRAMNLPKNSNAAADLYFITFPLFPSLEPLSNISILVSMSEILNFANNVRRNRIQYNCVFILFQRGEDNSEVNIRWIDEKNLIIESNSAVDYFVIPHERSPLEKRIADVYGMPNAHAMLQTIPGEGETIKASEAVITVLESDKYFKKKRLKIELKEPPGRSRDRHLFIYEKGRFSLAEEFEGERLRY